MGKVETFPGLDRLQREVLAVGALKGLTLALGTAGFSQSLIDFARWKQGIVFKTPSFKVIQNVSSANLYKLTVEHSPVQNKGLKLTGSFGGEIRETESFFVGLSLGHSTPGFNYRIAVLKWPRVRASAVVPLWGHTGLAAQAVTNLATFKTQWTACLWHIQANYRFSAKHTRTSTTLSGYFSLNKYVQLASEARVTKTALSTVKFGAQFKPAPFVRLKSIVTSRNEVAFSVDWKVYKALTLSLALQRTLVKGKPLTRTGLKVQFSL